jgi:hypothetical protein
MSGVTLGAVAAIDRRSLLGIAAALAAFPGAALAGTAGAGPSAAAAWTLATQVLAGTRLRDPTFLSLALEALAAESGAATVDDLLAAALARDADDVVRPFEDAAVEKAARRFVEIVYTGELPAAGSVRAVGFHQALAWQVLAFTKPPSVCGPGFGWWADAPEHG